MTLLKTFCKRIMEKRPPDVVIGERYIRRWHVWPRNKFINLYLHEFLDSDDDRALHDHPWMNLSYLVEGSYVEQTIENGGIHKYVTRRAGDMKFRLPGAAHRIILPSWSDRCITLFLTGPMVRKWGFHCPKEGWVALDKMTTTGVGGEIITRGCLP